MKGKGCPGARVSALGVRSGSTWSPNQRRRNPCAAASSSPNRRMLTPAPASSPARSNWKQRYWRSDRKSTTSELQSPCNLVCRLLLEKKKKKKRKEITKKQKGIRCVTVQISGGRRTKRR